MPISTKAFAEGDVYINYPQETVTFHFDHANKTVARKFYGDNFAELILFSNKLFSEAIRLGETITAEQFNKGFPGPKIFNNVSSTMDCKVINEKNQIQINGKVISLPFKIKNIVDCGNILAILADRLPNQTFNENIFGVNENGIIWQIEKISNPKSFNPYHTIEFKNSVLFAWDEMGVRDSIDTKTGKIINSEFVK